jgi:hypothetical protein
VSNETEVLDTPAAGPAAIRGSAIRLVAYGAGIVLALASAPLLIRHLGVADFGRYALVGSLLALMTGLTDAGLVSVAQREYVARQGEDRRRLLRELLGLRIVLSVAAVGVAIGFAAVAGYGATLVAGTAIAGVGFVLLGVQSIIAVPLLASLRLGRLTAVDLLRQVLTVGLILGLIAGDAGLLWFIALTLPVSAAVTAVTAVLVRDGGLLRPAFTASAWWPLLRDVAPFAAATAITAVYFRISLVLLSLVASDVETGLYATSYRILEVVIAIPALLVSTVFPVITRAADTDPAAPALRRRPGRRGRADPGPVDGAVPRPGGPTRSSPCWAAPTPRTPRRSAPAGAPRSSRRSSRSAAPSRCCRCAATARCSPRTCGRWRQRGPDAGARAVARRRGRRDRHGGGRGAARRGHGAHAAPRAARAQLPLGTVTRAPRGRARRGDRAAAGPRDRAGRAGHGDLLRRSGRARTIPPELRDALSRGAARRGMG